MVRQYSFPVLLVAAFVFAAITATSACAADVQVLNTKAEVDALIRQNTNTFVSHFAKSNEGARKALVEASVKLTEFIKANPQPSGDVAYADIEDQVVGKEYGFDYSPSLTFFKSGKAQQEFDFFTAKGFNTDVILAYLKKSAYGIADEPAASEKEAASAAPAAPARKNPLEGKEDWVVVDEFDGHVPEGVDSSAETYIVEPTLEEGAHAKGGHNEL